MNARRHTATITVAALIMALTCSAAQAHKWQGGHGGGGSRGGNLSHGNHHGGHGGHGGYRGGGPFWGGIGLGIGLGLGSYYIARPWYSEPAFVDHPPTAYYSVPSNFRAPLLSAVPTAPDPIFYPRTGQSAPLTEADRQACNRWVTTQPSAMADASVFHRAILACMDGRGYTSR